MIFFRKNFSINYLELNLHVILEISVYASKFGILEFIQPDVQHDIGQPGFTF